MDAITKFDRSTCRLVSEVAEKALADALAPYGLTVEFKGGSYTATGEYKPKVVIATEGAGEAEFASLARLVGLEPDDYGKEFVSGGRTFRITGVNLKARKYPVCAEALDDGRGYKFPESAVRVALGRPASPYAA